jgi:hypothetical protein
MGSGPGARGARSALAVGAAIGGYRIGHQMASLTSPRGILFLIDQPLQYAIRTDSNAMFPRLDGDGRRITPCAIFLMVVLSLAHIPIASTAWAGRWMGRSGQGYPIAYRLRDCRSIHPDQVRPDQSCHRGNGRCNSLRDRYPQHAQRWRWDRRTATGTHQSDWGCQVRRSLAEQSRQGSKRSLN